MGRRGTSAVQCGDTPRATTDRLKQPGRTSERTEVMFPSMSGKRQAEAVSLRTPVLRELCLIKAFKGGINSHLSLSLSPSALPKCFICSLLEDSLQKNTSGFSPAGMGRRNNTIWHFPSVFVSHAFYMFTFLGHGLSPTSG